MVTTKRFSVPKGAVARVRIIDSTTSIKGLPTDYLMTPPMPGMEVMPEIPTWSFLVESEKTGKKALFDLGVPPNWRDFSPVVVDGLVERGWEISGDKHVADILREESMDPSSINCIVWSFEEDGVLRIGQFRAFDLFGDGSFYLLDTPGHAIGHLAGLARTTPDSFIMMGGDLCHHAGELRPSELLPLPAEIRLAALNHYRGGVCPGAEFEEIQKTRSRAPNQTFFDPNMGLDIPETIRTIKKVQEADAEDNVLFIYAHDGTIKGIVDMFPAEANDWKAKDVRQKVYWRFLEDFKGALKGQA
ncbi:hypothetical protein LTR40_004615 [Exophiala xenobiotica]|nr:hypothetical protein LTR40_004615 [Exophiala xenobiotica]